MSHDLSHTFAEQLQARRTALLAHLREQRGGRVGRAEAAATEREQASDDWAVADAERDMAFELAERETAELSAIADALDRIRDGSYGLCGECGVELPAARPSDTHGPGDQQREHQVCEQHLESHQQIGGT